MKKQVINKLITEMKQMLDNKKSLTVESLVFNESEEDYGYDKESEEQIPTENEYEIDVDTTPSDSGVETEVKPMIDQIRKMALQGISKLAEHPESETYNTLKKIWQLVDKAIESQNKTIMNEK